MQAFEPEYLTLAQADFASEESLQQEYGAERGTALWREWAPLLHGYAAQCAKAERADGPLPYVHARTPTNLDGLIRYYVESPELQESAVEAYEAIRRKHEAEALPEPVRMLLETQCQIGAVLHHTDAAGRPNRGGVSRLTRLWTSRQISSVSEDEEGVDGAVARVTDLPNVDRLLDTAIRQLADDLKATRTLRISQCEFCPRLYRASKSDQRKCPRCPASVREKRWKGENPEAVRRHRIDAHTARKEMTAVNREREQQEVRAAAAALIQR